MKQKLIISAMGSDRPGIVQELSDFILKHHANIDDSRMTALSGEFAIIIQVSAEEQDLQLLNRQLKQEMPRIGLDYISKLTSLNQGEQQAIPYRIAVLSMDNPGIVNQITHYFSDKKINIISMQTDSYPAPHTGTQMFSIDMTVSIAASDRAADIKDDFIEMCDHLNLDANFEVKR